MGDLKLIKPIFAEALGKQGPERQVYLDEACGHDPGLRAQIEALLEAHEGAGDFLETPPLAVHATIDESSPTEGPGSIIGRYKLLERIGEGGFGVVWAAEQKRPVKR